MAETKSFIKILHVREREKMDAQKSYQHSMDVFEQIATKFYHLLKKKENAEATYDALIHDSTTLDKVKEQASYIEKLNTQIVRLQSEVQQARSEMEVKQSKLTDAHVEVKKFQSIIESRHHNKLEYEKKLERKQMDELSLQQHLSYKNR